jgi:hypothetical protein
MDLFNIAKTDLVNVFFDKGMLTEITKKQLDTYAVTWGVSGFQALIDCAIYEEEDLISFCAEYFRMSRVFDLLEDDVDLSILMKFDIRKLMEHFFIPYDFDFDTKTLKVVVSCPTSVVDIAEILSVHFPADDIKFEFSIATVQQTINFLGRFYKPVDAKRSAEVFKEDSPTHPWKS